MLRRYGLIFARFLAPLVFIGCQGNPYSQQYTRTKPDAKDIVGVWSLNAASRSAAEAEGYDTASTTLDFRADGSVTAQKVPDWWNFDNRRVKGALESGSGTWNRREEQGHWVIEINFPKINGKSPGQAMWLNLGGQKPPYKIIATVGDPDAGNAMIFERGPVPKT